MKTSVWDGLIILTLLLFETNLTKYIILVLIVLKCLKVNHGY